MISKTFLYRVIDLLKMFKVDNWNGWKKIWKYKIVFNNFIELY